MTEPFAFITRTKDPSVFCSEQIKDYKNEVGKIVVGHRLNDNCLVVESQYLYYNNNIINEEQTVFGPRI